VAKRRVGKYPKEFRRMAVERLKTCDNIVELSQSRSTHALCKDLLIESLDCTTIGKLITS